MAMGIWLPGGGGADLDAVTAGAGDVLAGKVIVDQNGNPLTGTMPERGAWSSSELAAGASVAIPAGHHNGNGKVTAKSLASQTPGTATAAQILSGQTAWVNGAKVTGSMANRGAYNGTGNSRGNDTGNKRMWVKVPGGYYNENAQVFLSWNDIKNYLGITPDKIKKGVTIMDITGSFEGSAENPLYLYRLEDGDYTNSNGFLSWPSRVNESGIGEEDYDRDPMSVYCHATGSNAHSVLYKCSDDIILTPYNTIHVSLDCYPVSSSGSSSNGEPAAVRRFGVGSTGMSSNSFNAVLDCPGDATGGKYSIDIRSLTGTFRFYIYIARTGGGGSRSSGGSKIVIREVYLT